MLSIRPPSQDEGSAAHRPDAPPETRADAARRRRQQREFAAAVEAGCLALDFQPRLSLDTGRQTDVEAVLRWPHPRRGQMPQSVFTQLAEATGRSAALGGWMLAAACRNAVAWEEPWNVSVRVLAHQIDRGTLLTQVAAALECSGLDPARLELALAESTVVNVSLDQLLMLSAIRDLGAGIALDEFGAGLASLTMLKRLPLTAMKLDRSLVRDLPADTEDAAIVQAVIAAAHALGVCVIAEGIETEPQRAFLSGAGCDGGQGSLFSLPLPAAALRRRT